MASRARSCVRLALGDCETGGGLGAQGAPSGFAVSTKANTVTFARSWPERHVQVVLYTMPSVGHILAFADLDCALDGLEIAAQSFSRSILGGELRNLSPLAF